MSTSEPGEAKGAHRAVSASTDAFAVWVNESRKPAPTVHWWRSLGVGAVVLGLPLGLALSGAVWAVGKLKGAW